MGTLSAVDSARESETPCHTASTSEKEGGETERERERERGRAHIVAISVKRRIEASGPCICPSVYLHAINATQSIHQSTDVGNRKRAVGSRNWQDFQKNRSKSKLVVRNREQSDLRSIIDLPHDPNLFPLLQIRCSDQCISDLPRNSGKKTCRGHAGCPGAA